MEPSTMDTKTISFKDRKHLLAQLATSGINQAHYEHDRKKYIATISTDGTFTDNTTMKKYKGIIPWLQACRPDLSGVPGGQAKSVWFSPLASKDKILVYGSVDAKGGIVTVRTPVQSSHVSRISSDMTGHKLIYEGSREVKREPSSDDNFYESPEASQEDDSGSEDGEEPSSSSLSTISNAEVANLERMIQLMQIGLDTLKKQRRDSSK
jgi:hypothetical protein